MNKTKKNFNAKVYLDLYPDVKKKYTIDTAWHHYNEYGKQENRIFTNKSLIKLFDGTYIDRETAMVIFGIPTNSRFAKYRGNDGGKQTELFLDVYFRDVVSSSGRELYYSFAGGANGHGSKILKNKY